MATTAREMRERAERLRRLSYALTGSTIADLATVGGPDTWRGPTATAFADTALAARRTLDDAVDDLTRASHWLLVEADRVEIAERIAAAAAAAGVPPTGPNPKVA